MCRVSSQHPRPGLAVSANSPKAVDLLNVALCTPYNASPASTIIVNHSRMPSCLILRSMGFSKEGRRDLRAAAAGG